MGTKFYKSSNLFWNQTKLFRILTIFLVVLTNHFSLFSQTSLSFSQISTSTEVMGPGRGAEMWQHLPWDNGQGHGVEIPQGNTVPGVNYYTRFAWKEIESDNVQGSYSWTNFDQRIQQAIDAGQMFSFGIMPICAGCSIGQIPTYLHNLMQAQPSNLQDWYYSGDGVWIPNWNSPPYLARYKALLMAVADHIATTSYKGIPYSKVIYYVDIRGYGNYGEWHQSPWYQSTPSNANPTAATLDSLISYNLQAFPNYPNVILAGAFSNTASSFVPFQTTYYALTAKNNWGPIGWRRDQWGDAGTDIILSNNPGSYNPGTGNVSFNNLILNVYKNAPVVGEPNNSASGILGNCGTMHCDLPREIQLYHASSFGNGNYPNTGDANLQSNVITASRIAGYRIVLTGGSMTTQLSPNTSFNVTLNWQNIGVAPSYENWTITYELRNSSGSVAWSGNSIFKLKLFLPTGAPTSVSDNFTLSAVPQGTYSLYLIIRDPNGYKKPFPLAITGRNSDGSYLIRSNISVGASSNQPPTANAGANQTIQLPASTATLTGTGSDADGTVSSYSWTQASGPATSTIANPSAASTAISGLVQGIYVYRLSVTDNAGAVSTATVQVTVNAAAAANAAPVANAGTDITITQPANSTTLNGSSSVDPDGSITNYAWTKISGPAQYSIANTSLPSTVVNNLVPGTYSFRLKVTDNGGATASDTVVVTVNAAAPANQNPVAKAGADITVTLPTNVVNLNGSGSNDPDGTIASYAWTEVSGPSQYSIASPSAAKTSVNNLVQGVYQFKLTVTDNAGATATDLINVTVSASAPPAGNQAPIANVGGNLNITLPTNSAALNGSESTDPDGTIASYTWSKIGGPAQFSITDASAASTQVTGLVEGSYTFRLQVTDNGGLSGSDTLYVTVNAAAPAPNQSPVANAGSNISMTLPTNSTTLNGSSSYDPDGTISSYSWTKVSGPAGSSMANASSASASVSGLVQGQYVYALTVRDNNGATATDQVSITVNAAPVVNKTPVANAGGDISLILPVTTTTLNGTGSSDADGTISSFSWTNISGPSVPTITNASTATPTVSNLIVGQYVFQLKVTDNSGASSTDQMSVVVSTTPTEQANQTPVANAGKDTTIPMPASSAVLNGAGSWDPDGNIAGYSWKQVSGPNNSVIVNSTASSTQVDNLTQGSYTFELDVTDNKGAISSATVRVDVVSNLRFTSNLRVYPNPVSTTLNVQYMNDLTGKVVVNIFGAGGTQIFGAEYTKDQNLMSKQINVSTLPRGIYFIQILQPDGSKISKSFFKL
jgi:ribosomal protein L14